ncbi:Helicase_C-domain-containing protein, partial [Fragilariopsis cylindrus CCMP1102]
KSLVFSQFSATLNYLKAELPNYGFQFRSLSGDMSMNQRAKALKDFQNDPPTTIFLLSMRAGAVGINLTQANRIFLMEPSFNPALEAQAIGRCHRLGQKRPVETIRLIVKDSFEERMANFIEKKYGLSSGENVEDSNEENKDKKKSMDRMDNSKVRDLAGNLQTDKCTLVLEEFDALFGVEDIVLSVENSSDATKPEAGGGVKADKIISGIV